MSRPASMTSFVAASLLLVSSAAVAQQGAPGGIPWPDKSAPPAAGQPSSAAGSLAIKVTQGTPGEQPIGAIDVAVELYHRGMLVDTLHTRTDDRGTATIESLPIGVGVRPLVKVKYDDLDYQIGGGPMDAEHPHQDIEVVCYATTEAPPAWSVQTRHMMVTPEAGGVRVTEVMMVQNPDQRTWVGNVGLYAQAPTDATGKAKRDTTAFVLPEGATDVQLGRGFHKWCCSTIAGDRLVNHLPLMPEVSEMMFSYLLPAKDGTATLNIAAPSDVGSTMLMTPTTLEAGTTQGLTFGGEQSMGDSAARIYSAPTMARGQKASITFVNLAAPAAPAASAQPAAGMAPAGSASEASTTKTSGGGVAKIVAGVGGGVILAVAAFLLLRRSGGADGVA